MVTSLQPDENLKRLVDVLIDVMVRRLVSDAEEKTESNPDDEDKNE